ncbi:N-acetylmuramoyl-L-alanine amidase [uncultured Actinomyces sp.]|uniref:N-acetylmuramoyl-L-alanine amidase n=1 Tax=uncultured Actinomyces sp. TaxID=249061 RepID=UPI00041E76E7|nr:N-acetylmuramoyl-L-alanine amidase [uncultured Actinomyces sp.]
MESTKPSTDPIDKIVLHHNAGTLSIRGCYDVWQTREASAHYQVDVNGRIGQLVWDRDTAWHAGNLAANRTSIGIEHANATSTTSPITEATLDAGAHLVAAICIRYRLGRPAWGVNVFGHKHFSATACPGHIAGDQNSAYMARAQHWYDQMTGTATPTPPPPAPAPAPDLDALADAVIRGEYGNGDERRHRLGNLYDQVQQRVNAKLTGSAPAPSAGPDLDALADAVIRGDYGNGDERRHRLGNLYDAFQARVNAKLS